jgi:hypothetical protein
MIKAVRPGMYSATERLRSSVKLVVHSRRNGRRFGNQANGAGHFVDAVTRQPFAGNRLTWSLACFA